MSYTHGRCTNVDYCSLASGRRDIEVPIGEDFTCPECAKPLSPPVLKQGSGGMNLALAGAAAALLLVGGGIYAGTRLSGPGHAPAAAMAPSASPARQVAALPAAAPAPASPAPASPAAAPAEQTVLLRLAGAPKLAAGLVPRLAAAYLTYLGDTGIATRHGQADTDVLVTGQRLSRPEAVTITGETDAAGLAALGRAQTEIALADRRITQPELDRLHALGDLTAPASEHAVAFEGEAVIVNPANPVGQLSMAQLRSVLDGSIPAWVAGSGRRIHLLAEPDSPDLAELLGGLPDALPGLRRVTDAAAGVLDDPEAVAVVPLARVGQAKVLALAAVGAAPARPTADAIASGAYPLSRKMYLYTAASGANPFVPRFVAFALSADGQDAVARAGLVPVVAAPKPAPVAPQTPKDRYRQLVTGAVRLSADLHFEPNSNKLDLHSARDVDRVWNTMMSDHTPPDHLIVIGFADNQGTTEANLALSQQRAQAVAGVFSRRGLPPGEVVAFGSDLPLGDNGIEDGRQKNRRVEVFLRP